MNLIRNDVFSWQNNFRDHMIYFYRLHGYTVDAYYKSPGYVVDHDYYVTKLRIRLCKVKYD